MLPATVFWINPAGGDWAVPGNWSTGALPGPGDDVVIDIPDADITVTHNTVSASVRSLLSQEAISIAGGGLSLADASVIHNTLSFARGTIGGAGTLTVNGLLTWSGSTMTGPGRTVANGGLEIRGVILKTLEAGRILENAATATWTDTGGIVIRSGAMLSNLEGAVFNVQTDAAITTSSGTDGPGRISNAGTFVKSASSETTNVAIRFDNSGTVEVQTGTLLLSGGGLPSVSSGAFTVAAGATLGLGAAHTLTAASSVTGAGSVHFSAGSFSGTVNVTGAYDPSGETQVNSGTVNFATDATLPTLTITGGTLAGLSAVTVTGLLTWTGGTMSGPGRTVAAGGLSISGPGTKSLDARTLDNLTAATWSGTGNILAGNNATFNNLAGAVFSAETDASFNFGLGVVEPRINNAGTFRKSASDGTMTVLTTFNNTGAVEVPAGTLRLGRGGVSSGTFTVEAGAALILGGNTHSLTPSSRVIGEGNVEFNPLTTTFHNVAGTYQVGGNTLLTGGTVNFTGDFSLPSLTLAGGTLGGVGTVTVMGPLTWAGGGMSGPGQTIALGGIVISGSDPKSLNRRTLDNLGTAIWTGTGGISVGNGAAWNNPAGSTLEVRTTASLTSPGGVPSLFDNAGTLRKLDAAGTTTFGMQLNNTGSVEVQTGTLSLAGGGTSGGTFLVAAEATLIFGAGTYNLQPASAVSGEGAIRFGSGPPAGIVNVAGTYGVGDTVINGAAVNFLNNITLPALTLNGGALAGSSEVTVAGLLIWTGGGMTGPGRTIALGGIAISGNSGKQLNGRTLDNLGTASWTGTGSIATTGSARFNNLAGALFDVQNNTSFGDFGGPGVSAFNNAGTFRKSAGAATSALNLLFNNTGIVWLEVGTLDLGRGGNSSGTFTVEAGATLSLMGFQAGHTLAPTSAIEGAGTVTFGNGPFSTAGTVNVLGAYHITGSTVINGATVTFVNDITLPTLSLQRGALAGPSEVTVTGLLTWIGGAMIGPGRTWALGGLTIAGAGGSFGSPTLDARTLDNLGTATVSGPERFAAGRGAVFNNPAGSLFEIQGGFFLFGGGLPGAAATFNNGGVLRKTAGSGDVSFALQLNNTGTVEVLTGTLNLFGGGFGSGTHALAVGTTLGLAGSSYTFGTTSRVTGAGNVTFSGIPFTIGGTYDISGTTSLNGATASFVNDVTFPRLNFSGAGSTLTGLGNFTVLVQLNWPSGTISGTGRLTSLGNTAVSGIGSKQLSGRTFDNAGTLTWTDAGTIFLLGDAALNNLAGATFEVRGNGNFTNGHFDNAGTFRKAVGAGTTAINAVFNNVGVVEVQTGTLNLARGGTSSGTFSVTEGATLLFGGGTHNLAGTSAISGGGNVTVNLVGANAVNVAGVYKVLGRTTVTSGALNFSGNATGGTLTLGGGTLSTSANLIFLGDATFSGGTLTGPGEVAVAGVLTWTGGTMTGTGRTTALGGLNVSGVANKTLNGRALDNTATATWTGTGPIVVGNGAVLTNLEGAVFDAQNDSSVSFLGGVGTFLNAGTLRKSAGSGTTLIATTFTNTGTVEVQTGILALSGAFSNFTAATFTLAGGTYLIQGTFRFPNADVRTNAANLVLDGPAAQVINQFGQDAVAKLSAITPAGSFILQGGRQLSVTEEFVNAGFLAVLDAGSAFATTRDFTQTDGVTFLAEGALSANAVLLLGGTLAGSGTVTSNVVNASRVEVGGQGTAGVLVINGFYVQTAEGVLAVEVGGVDPGTQYDQLRVSDFALLDGTLEVGLTDPFFPGEGDAFQVLTFGSRVGDFAVYNGLDLGGGLVLVPVFDDAALTLVAVLET